MCDISESSFSPFCGGDDDELVDAMLQHAHCNTERDPKGNEKYRKAPILQHSTYRLLWCAFDVGFSVHLANDVFPNQTDI